MGIFIQILIAIFIFITGIASLVIILKFNAKISRKLIDIRFGGILPLIIYILFLGLAYNANFQQTLLSLMIFFLVMFAMTYYIILILKDILNQEVGILKTMLKIGVSAMFVCIYYGIVYYSIYILRGQQSFTGTIGYTAYDQIISFLYFSFITFNTIGFGDITPATSFIRILVIMESIMYFIITLYAFSSISIIRDNIASVKSRK